ncbi:phage tail protein [Thalassospira sp. TSL5-1]|uniref:phage tail protein n=1 Tax=Thalassospira sp. TSL5-1 TaxID=1544451 RepID=UPI00093CA3E3|nr:tail fiber protein [Thalassospira sp. TSL5-1]
MIVPLKRTGVAGCLSALAIFILAFASLQNGAKASDCSEDGYLGTVCWTAATFCPRNYHPANGALMPLNNYQGLYSLISNRFGGNGVTNFALPDLRGRSIVGTGERPGDTNPNYIGQTYGKESVVLKTENLPSHSHKFSLETAKITGTLLATTKEGNSVSPENRIPAARPSNGLSAKKTPIYSKSPTGSFAAHIGTVRSDPEINRTEKAGRRDRAPMPLRTDQVGLLACININSLNYPRRE